MLCMSPAGVCTTSTASPPSPASALASHDFGHGAVLHMWASRVTTEVELASAELVVHPLPLPFGRNLMVGQVTWALGNGDVLSVKRWEELLDRLREAKSADRPQTVLLAPTLTSGAPAHHADLHQNEHEDCDDDNEDGLSEYECGDGDNEEDQEEQEEQDDDDDDDDDDVEDL